MVSRGLCLPARLPPPTLGGGRRFPGVPSLTVLLSLLQAKFLSQDQINGRLALLFN